MERRQASLPRICSLAAILHIILATADSEAANILWDTPTVISADSDVSTTGSLLYAYTFGNSPASTTVNGVTFAIFSAPSGTTSRTVGSVTVTEVGSGTLESTNTSTGSASTPFSNLSSAYQGLLQSASSVSGAANSMTLAMGGLISGTSYQVEIWSNESNTWLHTVTTDAKTSLTAGNSITLDMNNTNAVGGVGQWVTGTFTADAAIETITMNSSPGVLNGFQVRTVPEPTSVGLLSIGVVFLASRRKSLRAVLVRT